MSAARPFDRPYDRARAPVTVVVGNGMARCRSSSIKNDWCSREESSARSNLRGLWSDPWLTTRAVEKPTSAKPKVSA